MTAKIIQFPGDCCVGSALPAPEIRAGQESLVVSLHPLGFRSNQPRTVSLAFGSTLADLHRAIVRNFRWEDAHNYFFSQGNCRFEDPLLFAGQDCIAARMRRVQSAADISAESVLTPGAPPLYYMYNLALGRELAINLAEEAMLKAHG